MPMPNREGFAVRELIPCCPAGYRLHILWHLALYCCFSAASPTFMGTRRESLEALGSPGASAEQSAYQFDCNLSLPPLHADHRIDSVFLMGMSWFLVWSIAVAVAPNEVSIDIFRAMQGAGMGAAIPSALGILGRSFAPSQAKVRSLLHARLLSRRGMSGS